MRACRWGEYLLRRYEVFIDRFCRKVFETLDKIMIQLRLQKYLSECGVCSRRHAEEAIKNGEVIVNGSVAQI